MTKTQSPKAGERTRKFGHTDGPWKVMQLNGKVFVTAKPFPEEDGCIQVAEVTHLKNRLIANASLLAAAPELFAFVKAYANEADCGDGGEHDEDKSHGRCWHCTATRLVNEVEGNA